MLKILHLVTENIQRIKAVDITPGDNSLVIVGGNNGHGKTSLLDSIMFALGGKRSFSEKPVRDGAKEGTVELTIGEFTVKRTIRPSGDSQLEVTESGVGTVSSPQKLLEKFTSALTFDPLAFSTMKQEEQIKVLKSLIPFDFTGNDKLRKAAYDERTGVNRDLKQKEAENEAQPYDPGFPVDEEAFDSSVYQELTTKQAALTTLLSNVEKAKAKIIEADEAIAKWQAAKDSMESWLQANESKVTEFGDIDKQLLEADSKRIQHEQRQARIRANAAAKRIFEQSHQLKANADALTAKIEKLDAEKMSAISSAALPVGGLSFLEESGVVFNGIPFSQLSGAERLKVSLAMGIALNPQLRVLLIRDGSLLDDANLEVVARMAADHDMQVWIERVGKGVECSVIIEDGTVIENRMKEQEDARPAA